MSFASQLKDELLTGKITPLTAMKRISSRKPWKTKEWQIRRAEVLKPECGCCGTKEGPLVVQHTWHPALFSENCEVVKVPLLEEFKKTHPYPPDPLPLTVGQIPVQPHEHRASCPRCGSVNVKQRKNGEWSCKARGGKCGHEFSTPVMIDYRKWEEEGWIRRCQSQHQWEGTAPQRTWREAFMSQYRDRILLEAALLSIADHERYVALREEDIVTRCKKCAFLEDLHFRDGYSQGVHAERQRREASQS